MVKKGKFTVRGMPNTGGIDCRILIRLIVRGRASAFERCFPRGPLSRSVVESVGPSSSTAAVRVLPESEFEKIKKILSYCLEFVAEERRQVLI